MLKALRLRLRKVAFLHHFYVLLKRRFTGELLGMTTRTEQEYCTRYGETMYRGRGEVVDLGCWLGSTTLSLVKGLQKNPAFRESGRKVYAYDAFIWYEGMAESSAGTALGKKYRAGDSFLDEYQRRTAEFAPLIEIKAGDLTTAGWEGEPVEFLLVDAMKNWELSNAIIRDFYPHLIPGESFVLQQDFAHYFTVWIHLIHWRLRDYFEFETDVPESSSVVFRNTKKIPAELLNKEHSFADFSDDDIKAAIDYSLSFAGSDKEANIRAAGVMAHTHQNEFAKAEKLFKEIEGKGVKIEQDLAIVQALLAARKQ